MALKVMGFSDALFRHNMKVGMYKSPVSSPFLKILCQSSTLIKRLILLVSFPSRTMVTQPWSSVLYCHGTSSSVPQMKKEVCIHFITPFTALN